MSDDALGAQKIQQQRSAKEAGAEKAANRTTMRNPKLEGDTQGDHPRGQARISDGHHVTNRNLPGSLSGVRVRHARIFMAKQTRVSSLLAPHGPHIGHICSTPPKDRCHRVHKGLVRCSEKESKSPVQVLKM